MGVYMGVFNFFIVIPEIVASFAFGPIIKAIFGDNSTTAPLYVVMAGGFFMLIAAACVLLVNDVTGTETERIIQADEKEPLTVQQSVQPVPGSGVIE
jgi:maltose/moltooligosaccharide transporter